MVDQGWLREELIFPRVEATSVNELLTLLAPAMASASGRDLAAVEVALWRALSNSGSSLGHGIALPHAYVDGLEASVVALVALARPLPLPSLDGRPPDLLFVILSPPDAPHAHLLMLAHLARLAQSEVLLTDLREATTVDEVVTRVRGAEGRVAPAGAGPLGDAQGVLVTVTLAGEEAIDSLLVDLVAMGLEDATILEGQSLREAVSREVPLFSGFRDLFGDPGGRRVLMIETEAPRVEEIIATVRTVCDNHRVRRAEVSAIPLRTRWVHVAREAERGGH